MKAITLWQPWGSLIMIGAKPNEFRPKPYTAYIGAPKIGDEVVIHAGARPVRLKEVTHLLRSCKEEDGGLTGLIVERAIPLLERIAAAPRGASVVPLAAGLGTAVLGAPVRADAIYGGLLPHDSDRGDFNYAWPIVSWKVWPEPIPMRGLQGFWEWPLQEAA